MSAAPFVSSSSSARFIPGWPLAGPAAAGSCGGEHAHTRGPARLRRGRRRRPSAPHCDVLKVLGGGPASRGPHSAHATWSARSGTDEGENGFSTREAGSRPLCLSKAGPKGAFRLSFSGTSCCSRRRRSRRRRSASRPRARRGRWRRHRLGRCKRASTHTTTTEGERRSHRHGTSPLPDASDLQLHPSPRPPVHPPAAD